MSGNGIRVHGGAGGLSADLAAMNSAAGVLVGVGGDLAGLALRTAALAVDPALIGTAALDPVGFARVQRGLLPVVSGPGGLGSCAARVTALGVAVTASARAYAASEAATAALLTHLRDGLADLGGRAVGMAATRFLPYTAAAASLAFVGWSTFRGAPMLFDEAMSVGVDAHNGDLDLLSLDERFVRMMVEHALVMRRDAETAGRRTLGWFAEHPAVAEHALAAVPSFLDGLTGPLVVPGALVGEDVDGLVWPPEDVEELAALLSALGAVSPYLVEGEVEVTAVAGPAPVAAGGVGLAGAVRRLVPYSPPLPPDGVPPRVPAAGTDVPYEPGRVRVERIERPGGTAWSVSVPPTQTWALDGGANPFDGSTNVRSVGDRPTAAAQAVTEALRQAGAAHGEPVMLAGYSQGGLTAVQLAADPAFRDEFSVSTVLSLGSPVGAFDVPADVQVLSVQHAQDLTAALDGTPNPDRPSWTTVTRDLSHPSAAGPGLLDDLDRDPFTAHRIEYYLDTAEVLDREPDESVAAWQKAAAPFLDTSDATVHVTQWQATRVPTRADP